MTDDDFARLVRRADEEAVGQCFRIRGLTSAAGSDLNGLIGFCEGFTQGSPTSEPTRLHLRVRGHDTVYRVKVTNTVPADAQVDDDGEDSPDAAGWAVADRKRLQDVAATWIPRMGQSAVTAKKQLAHHAKFERDDVVYRAQRVIDELQAVGGGAAPTALPCGDFGNVRAPFVLAMQAIKPACAGNGQFSVRDLFRGDADNERAALRLCEYPVSGFCVACQIAYMEQE